MGQKIEGKRDHWNVCHRNSRLQGLFFWTKCSHWHKVEFMTINSLCRGEQVVSMRCPANLWRWVCSQGPGRHQELNWTTFKKPFAFWFNRVRAAASSSWKDRILKWRRRSRDLKLGSNSSPPPLLNLTFQRRRRNKNIFSCRGDLGMEHFSGWIGW